MKTSTYTILFCLLLISCEQDDWSRGGYEPIAETMLYDSISPAFPHDYWEIRETACWDSSHYLVLYSKGEYPLADSVFYSKGIFFSPADYCFCGSVLTVDGGVPTFWATYDDLVYFLSPIDCIGDALLLARWKGYTFKYNDAELGYKLQNGKIMLRALKLVLLCDPVRTDKFLLEVDQSGKIKVLNQEVYRELKGACI